MAQSLYQIATNLSSASQTLSGSHGSTIALRLYGKQAYVSLILATSTMLRVLLSLVLICRKNRLFQMKDKAILRLSNHPSRDRFVLSHYWRFLELMRTRVKLGLHISREDRKHMFPNLCLKLSSCGLVSI